jgi:AAA+ ATPase superfamily predicted ATPase
MNPYFNRGAITDPAYFFGRKELLNHIYGALNVPKPMNISIKGERRIGKSSLLNYLMHPEVKRRALINPERFVFVLTDFLDYQPQDAADFIRTLHYYLCLELERVGREDISCDAHSILEQVESFTLKQTRQLKDGLKRHLMRLKDAGYHIVFLIDEADSVFLRANLDYSVFDFMRSLADVSRYYSVSYIIASRRPLREISKALESSRFHNIFAFYKLGLFSHEEALELIRIPSQQAGVQFSSEEEKFILDLAGRHPLALQIVCYYLFEQKTMSHLVDTRALTDIAFAQMKSVMADWWEDSSNEERQALQAIAIGSSALSAISRETIERLMERSLVIKEQDSIECFCKLFKRFVLQESLTRAGKRRDDTSDMVMRWIEEGESQTVEFKRKLPENMTRLAKEIAAFASGEGGVILIGVDDNGKVCGLPIRSPQERDRFRQRIYGIATKIVKPPVNIEIDFIEMQGKVLGIIQIPPGKEPLYYVENRPYIRYGCITESPGPDEIAKRYSETLHTIPGVPFLAQKKPKGLREEVWKLIETVELGLRQFIAKVMREKVGQDWEQFLAKRHPALYESWITIQERHRRSFKRYGSAREQKETILDYSFINDLGSLIAADWEFYRHLLDFGRSSSKENKRYWAEIIEAITKVRNALAHHRFVPENELKRAEVFCNDIIVVLGTSMSDKEAGAFKYVH